MCVTQIMTAKVTITLHHATNWRQFTSVKMLRHSPAKRSETNTILPSASDRTLLKSIIQSQTLFKTSHLTNWHKECATCAWNTAKQITIYNSKLAYVAKSNSIRMEMRIHPNHLGMFPHYIEACHKGHFIKKIIILKNKDERVIRVLQRGVNLSLERRTISMTFRLNNIEIKPDSI